MVGDWVSSKYAAFCVSLVVVVCRGLLLSFCLILCALFIIHPLRPAERLAKG